MSPVDLAWLRMDQPANLMNITGLLFFEQGLSFEELSQVVEQRLLPIHRFRQRVELGGLGARWIEAERFDLLDHVERLELPAPGDQQALQRQVSELLGRPLDRDRPLWKLHLVEGYDGGSVVICRLHHCIGDGVALMLVMLSLTDFHDEAERPLENPLRALFQRGTAKIEHAIEHARELMPQLMRLVFLPSSQGGGKRRSRPRLALALSRALGRVTFMPADPRTVFKGPLGIAKTATWSKAIALEDVKAVSATIGGTLNDVLLTAMTGGLRHYLLSRDHPVENLSFRAAMPVNLRSPHKLADLGNQFGIIFLPLPVGIGDPRERLAELRRSAEALKKSVEPGVTYGLLHGMGMSPHAIQKLIVRIFGTKATAVMTNVPGPQQRIYLAGKPLTDILFWVPQSGKVGLGISILSYAGKVRLGVTTDAGLVPDPEVIIEGFHRELESLLALARQA
jgi:WS/DGAT/MGAT family acyltransferase